jgi:hypothetical protein
MEDNTYQPVCDSCGKVLRLVPAGVSKKTGKNYGAFWSCDRTCGTTKPYASGTPKQPEPPKMDTGFQMVMDEVNRVNKRLEHIWNLLKQINDKLPKSQIHTEQAPPDQI